MTFLSRSPSNEHLRSWRWPIWDGRPWFKTRTSKTLWIWWYFTHSTLKVTVLAPPTSNYVWFLLILANDDQVKLPWTSKFEDDQCLEPNDAHLKLVTPKFEEAHLMVTNSKWSSIRMNEKRQTLFNYMLVTTSSVTNLKWLPSAPKKQEEMNINMLVAISSCQALLCECYILQHHQQ